MADEQKPSGNQLEGEGSYTATRRYNKHVAEHQREEDVEQLADEAREALEGEEGEELQKAEELGKRGPHAPPASPSSNR